MCRISNASSPLPDVYKRQSLWCDLVYLLERLGKDLRNPRFICPPDFKAVSYTHLVMIHLRRY